MYHFDPYNVLLAIATNIPVLLMTAFVLQGHILTPTTQMCIKIFCRIDLDYTIHQKNYNTF